jgi:dethiobiotin synthetase
MTARGVFVTGTDTGVGKTLIACGLVRGLAALGARVAVMKPVASGAEVTAAGLRNADARALAASSNVSLPYEQINPYCFEPPISPHIAAKEAGIEIDISKIKHIYDTMASDADWVVVEGAGGWFTPLSEHQSMADLAWGLSIPALMVVGVRLGCLNHAQLTRLAIEARGVTFAGWVGSCVDAQLERREENLATLERVLGERALAVLPPRDAGAAPLCLPECATHLAQLKRLTRLE